MFGSELVGIEEHMDHEMGRYQNEFQAAYDLSRLTQEYPRDKARIDAIVAAGHFAVAVRYPVYCVHTDALLGMATRLVSEHDTREQAEAARVALSSDDDPEYEVAVYPLPPPAPLATASRVAINDDSDIPF